MINDGYKKEPLTAFEIHSVPKLIRVIAPTNLPGGYQLEVQTASEPSIAFTAYVVRKLHFASFYPLVCVDNSKAYKDSYLATV